MDSPIISRLFRQLFTHRPCQALRSHSALPFRIQYGRRTQIRGLADGRGGAVDKNESHWQQRTDLFPQDMSEEYKKYPMVTADQLRGRKERPRRVKMLTRDFIEGMLRSRSAKCILHRTDTGQILSIIHPMGTFRNKLLFSPLESHSTSTISRMNSNFTNSWGRDIQSSRTSWTRRNRMRHGSSGTLRQSFSDLTMAKLLRDT